VRRGAPLAVLTPLGVTVPVDEADQGRVDLVDEPPDPVHPEWVEALDGGPADRRTLSPQDGRQPAHDALGHCFIDSPVSLEGEPRRRPRPRSRCCWPRPRPPSTGRPPLPPTAPGSPRRRRRTAPRTSGGPVGHRTAGGTWRR